MQTRAFTLAEGFIHILGRRYEKNFDHYFVSSSSYDMINKSYEAAAWDAVQTNLLLPKHFAILLSVNDDGDNQTRVHQMRKYEVVFNRLHVANRVCARALSRSSRKILKTNLYAETSGPRGN